jgi:hypothetical protein
MSVLTVALGIVLSNGACQQGSLLQAPSPMRSTTAAAGHRTFDVHDEMTDTEDKTMTERQEDCRLVGVGSDGALVISVGGVEQTMAIFGVEVDDPPPALYLEIIAKRLPQTGHPLRCTVRTTGPGMPRAQFLYFAWQDKTGDVWQDLAVTLLEHGIVRVADGDFPERADYLRHEKSP